jgi:hypothetical protein
MALDEVLLEVQRLDLVRRHDHLEVGDPLGQLRLLVLADALLEVAPYPRPQRLRLADVEHATAGVSKDVDARLCRQPLQLLLEVWWCNLRHTPRVVLPQRMNALPLVRDHAAPGTALALAKAAESL